MHHGKYTFERKSKCIYQITTTALVNLSTINQWDHPAVLISQKLLIKLGKYIFIEKYPKYLLFQSIIVLRDKQQMHAVDYDIFALFIL